MNNNSNLVSVSCIQYNSKNNELNTLEIIKPLISKAIALGSDFITLPECATSLHGSPEITKNLAQSELINNSLDFFKKIAKVNSVHILVGSLPIKIKLLIDLF